MWVDAHAGEVRGLTALDALIAVFHQRLPHLLEAAGPVDQHHQVLRVNWLLRAPDGSVFNRGMYSAQTNPGGRLIQVTGFLDPQGRPEPGERT